MRNFFVFLIILTLLLSPIQIIKIASTNNTQTQTKGFTENIKTRIASAKIMTNIDTTKTETTQNKMTIKSQPDLSATLKVNILYGPSTLNPVGSDFLLVGVET